MRPADRARPARRRLAYIALVALAGVAMLALSQCKLVDERLTGVASPFKGNPTDCFADCAHKANDLIRAESQLHVTNVHNCSGDETCLANEEARHEAAVASIQAGRQECQAGCHQQGTGSGGR